MSISNIKSLLTAIVLIIYYNVLTGQNNNSRNYYKEQVNLHLGRDTYIAGEKIWFKAYCKNLSKPELPALSKVIYIELLDARNGHVMGQILKAENGSSESCIDLPDTLSSGLYFIKAYTQWLKNFGAESFYSKGLYIYNYYNEGTDKQFETINRSNGPEIFIEGNNLIGGIISKIAVSLPELKGKEVPMIILDSETNQVLNEFSLNTDGIGFSEFIPEYGRKYYCTKSDSNGRNYKFELPAINSEGFKIEITTIDEVNVKLYIKKIHVIDQKLEVIVMADNIVLDKKIINQSMLDSELSLTYKGAKTSIVEIILNDTYGKLLATSAFRKPPSNSLQINSLKKIYHSGDKVDLSLFFSTSDTIQKLNTSVSIHKMQPSLKRLQDKSIIETYPNSKFCIRSLNKFADILLTAYTGKAISGARSGNEIPDPEDIYPLEDIGITYSGKVIDPNSKQPVPEIEVLYSLKDTTPNLQLATTNENGEFALLSNYSGNPQAFITLYKDKMPVSNQLSIIFDKKFYYQDLPSFNSLILQHADSTFLADVKDEAQRAFIQKAFTKRKNNFEENNYYTNFHPVYYSNSMITVLIDDFFEMPNFEEIAREVLPRVQYRKSKNECSLSVFTSKPEIKSNYPLVLLNGVPVDDKCEMYNLNSELINKIQIQHESRIVGNLGYDGLLSVISNPDKKLKNFKANSENLINLPCYKICPDFNSFDLPKTLNTVNIPDFRNQLFWGSFLIRGGNSQAIKFITSDEEGEYVIDIIGYTTDGILVNLQDNFTVISK